MKKTYITPEMEITRFNTEDIMNGSVITSTAGEESYNNSNAKVELSYNSLYSVN